VIKVHHLDVYLPSCGNEVRRIEVTQGKPIFFGDDLPNIKEGIGIGFFVPSEALDDIIVGEFLPLTVGASMPPYYVSVEKPRYCFGIERLPNLLEQLLREEACFLSIHLFFSFPLSHSAGMMPSSTPRCILKGLAPTLGGAVLPLFTKNTTRVLLGKRASGIRGSRNLRNPTAYATRDEQGTHRSKQPCALETTA